MSARRNKIKPKLMEALQMLKFALCQHASLDFTAGLNKETEIVKLECLMEKEVSLPTDMQEFVAKLNHDLEDDGDLFDDGGDGEYFDLELDEDTDDD